MLSTEERIKLRDELINIFKLLNIMHINVAGYARIYKKTFLNELHKDIDLAKKYNIYISQFRSEEEALYCLIHKDDYTHYICPICGNICDFYIPQKHYKKACDNKLCITKLISSDESKIKRRKTNLERFGNEDFFASKSIRDKIKQTNLKKYGAENVFQSKEIQDKIKHTNLTRYGVENVMQNGEVKEKMKQTNFERYGVENAMQHDEFKEKVKQTNLERYGVEYTSQSKEIQNKMKQTNLDRYGVEYTFQAKEIQDKSKQTNLDRYGVEYSLQSKEIQDKMKQTMLERYGVEHALQSKEIQDKVKHTNLERYNVEYAIQSKEIQDKVKRTNIERYGYECSSKNKEVKLKQFNTKLERYGNGYYNNVDKSKQTMLDKYGVEYSLQSKEIQDKTKQTILDKYGVEYAMQSKEIQDKSKKTCLKKYGVEYSLQSKEIQDKMKQTMLERYGVEHALQNDMLKTKARKSYQERYDNLLDPVLINEVLQLFNDKTITISDVYSNNDLFKEFIIKIYNKTNRLLQLKEIGKIFNRQSQTIKHRCDELNLLDYIYIRDIQLETQFAEFLDNNNIIYKSHDKSILHDKETDKRLEIDFVLNNFNIGIEINDVISHNTMYKDASYHYNKTLHCKEKGIRLIHIWEWELTNPILWDRLSNWILNLLNNSKITIGARKCTVKEVSRKEEKEFLNKYHLQGYKKSNICLGLYCNDELLAVESFCKPRYNKNYQYELLRLCTKYNYLVIGGAKKLLSNFIARYNPISIISYCDLSKFDGKVYQDLGFKLLRKSQPSAIWYNADNNKYFSQSSLNQHGADQLIGTNYGKDTNNEEIAYKSGYQKIYNCGMNVYIMSI